MYFDNFFYFLIRLFIFLQLSNKSGYTPLPFKSNVPIVRSSAKSGKSSKNKTNAAKPTQLHNKSVISLILAEKEKLNRCKQSSKVKPKLKAEVKMKDWFPDREELENQLGDLQLFKGRADLPSEVKHDIL